MEIFDKDLKDNEGKWFKRKEKVVSTEVLFIAGVRMIFYSCSRSQSIGLFFVSCIKQLLYSIWLYEWREFLRKPLLLAKDYC